MVTCNTANQYLVGNSAVITVNITVGNVLTDPTELQITIENPDKTIITTYVYGVTTDIIKVSTGIYKIIIDLEEVGIWRYRWSSNSPNTGAVEGVIVVNPSIL